MLDGKDMPGIALFVYQFPHRKSSEFLLDILCSGVRNVIALAAPKKILSHSDPRSYYQTSIKQPPVQPISELCRAFGIPYYEIEHNDDVRLSCIIDKHESHIGIIGGARIIPSKVIRLFRQGIINFHPGKIPETSGLDAFYYSIKKDVAAGVTAHFIDGRVDAGSRIWFDELPLGADDSIETVVNNGYWLQRRSLQRLLGFIAEGKKIPSVPIERPHKNNALNAEQKSQLITNFQGWRATQYVRQRREELFRACENGDLHHAEKLLDLHPSLLNSRSETFLTPLMVAAYNQHAAIVSMMIRRGAVVSDTGRNGTTVLMYAKTQLLNRLDDEYGLLDLLIDAGADMFARDAFDRDIFYYIEAAEDYRMIRYLRRRSEDQNAVY